MAQPNRGIIINLEDLHQYVGRRGRPPVPREQENPNAHFNEAQQIFQEHNYAHEPQFPHLLQLDENIPRFFSPTVRKDFVEAFINTNHNSRLTIQRVKTLALFHFFLWFCHVVLKTQYPIS